MKTKKILALLLSLIMVLGTVSLPVMAEEEIADVVDIGLDPVEAIATKDEWTADTSWYVGNESAKEYTISTPEMLAGFAYLVDGGNNFLDKTIKLDADIDLEGREWRTIGGFSPEGKTTTAFSGTFDGQGHKISNLKITAKKGTKYLNYSYVGLFGRVDGGKVSNFTIENADVQGSLYGGIVVGMAYTGTVSNIHVTGTVKLDVTTYVGVASGYGYANIDNVDVTGDEESFVNAESKLTDGTLVATYVGGIAGFRGEGNIKTTNCDVKIDVTGGVRAVGGIQGILHYGNTIDSCTYEGSITLTGNYGESNANQIGAIAGARSHSGNSTETIKNCTANLVGAEVCGDDVLAELGACGGNWDGADPATQYVEENVVINRGYCAYIGSDGYFSLADAAKNAVDGDTILVTAAEVAFPNFTTKNLTLKTNVGTKVISRGSVADGTRIDGFEYVDALGYNAKDIVIENCTFTGENGLRWCYANGTWLIKNCVFDTSVYGIHFDGNSNGVVNIEDCTISAFNTFASTVEMNIKNCTLKKGSKTSYSVLQSHGKMTVRDCVIKEDWLDVASSKTNFGTADTGAVCEVYNTVYEGGDIFETSGYNQDGIFAVDPVKNADGLYVTGRFSLKLTDDKIAPGSSVKASNNTYVLSKATDVLANTNLSQSEKIDAINNTSFAITSDAASEEAMAAADIAWNILNELPSDKKEEVSSKKAVELTELIKTDDSYTEIKEGEGESAIVKMVVPVDEADDIVIETIKHEDRASAKSDGVQVHGEAIDAEYYTIKITKNNVEVKEPDSIVIVELPMTSERHKSLKYVTRDHDGKLEILPRGHYDEARQVYVLSLAKFSDFAAVFGENIADGSAVLGFVSSDGAGDNEAMFDLYLTANDKATIENFASGEYKLESDRNDVNVEFAPADEFKYGVVDGVTHIELKESKDAPLNFQVPTEKDGKWAVRLGTYTVTGIGKGSLDIDGNSIQMFKKENKDSLAKEIDTSFAAIATYNIIPAASALEVNVKFNNKINNNAALYQDMKLTIKGLNTEGTDELIYNLGNDVSDDVSFANDTYTITIADKLIKDYTYTVSIEGAGYRKASYSVNMKTPKTLNFWNNVMTDKTEVEVGESNSAKTTTFLAGDIVKDNKINIYDLAAVVSYFGEKDLQTSNPDYAKYDLNRDGKVDSRDVAYVLVSWNN